MIDFAQSEIRAYFTARIPKLRLVGKQFVGACPIHHGDDENFKIDSTTGQWFCHSRCQRGGDIIALEEELTGRGFTEARDAVFNVIGRSPVLYAERDFVATYDYCDAGGVLIYQVVRKTPDESGKKRFTQRRPDGRGGWIGNLGETQPLPFMLPKLIAATGIVAIVEGEKDALTLDRLGIVATCNSGGAEKFRPELAKWFTGKRVAVFFDNDEPGRRHALRVSEAMKPVAESVRIVELPNLPAKGDVTDFVTRGGTKAQIKEAYDRAIEWTAEWEFGRGIPSEEDRYVRTPAQIIAESGGLAAFWELPEDEGIPTPFESLTRAMSGGLRDQEVYVIGADTGAGKTSLALQFAIHALRKKKGVLLFSMEMSHRDTLQRMASIEARVDLMLYREVQRKKREATQRGIDFAGPLKAQFDEMYLGLGRSTGQLEALPLLVSDKGGVNCQYVQAETERLSYRQKIHLVIVDHMQLMTTNPGEKVRGDYEKFTAISRAMKQTAKEMRVPVIQVSQTSRGKAKDGRHELEISDLRGSGAIEEDACAVMLLYPDQKDYAESLTTGTAMRGPVKTWLKLGKNRFGWKDWGLPLLHFKTCTRFDLMDEQGA